jgi:wobble nucleotide-excising tRNase
MKVTKFNRIKARTYRDFSWPSDLPEFADYNLIYGWNGTGKTTLSDILRMVEKRQSVGQDGVHDFSIAYGTKTISPANIAIDATPPSIRVFNRAFVEGNVFSENGATPIFFIGEENIEKQKELEKQRNALEKLKTDVDAKKKDKDQKEKELDNFCTGNATATRGWLSITNTQSYNKSHFKTDCEGLISACNTAQHAKTDDELAALKKTIASTFQPEITSVTLTLPDLTKLTEEVKTLLQKTVVSQTIESLTKDAATSEWVKQGLQLHKDHKSENCKFCEQRIPADRLKALEGHFNDEFKALDATLTSKISAMTQTASVLVSLQLPAPEKFYDDLKAKYNASCQKLNEQVSACVEFLGQLKAALEDKKSSPFVGATFDIAPSDHGIAQIDAVNTIIKEHNDKTKNFNQEIEAAKKIIKHALAAAAIAQYQELKTAFDDLEKEHSALVDKITADSTKVNALEQEIINHKKPAEDINKDLEDYLGHSEIRFATTDGETGYTIMRGDKPAHALSEGEKTAIALLHFLKSLEDTKFDLASGIVVIDDPVCSMDDTAMFHAFSYIKERTKTAKQLFILTHNFMFFRQVKNWFWHVNKHKKKLGKSASFYQTVCVSESGARVSRLRQLDKLLYEYNSEYQYLFDMTYKSSSAVYAGSGLSQYYHMPNVARRLLEAFLAFRMPGTTGELHNKMDQSTFAPAKKTGILRFLHTHSHEDQIGYNEHDSTILAETSQIMTDILEFIKFEDEKHYNEMILLVAPPVPANTNQTENAVSA